VRAVRLDDVLDAHGWGGAAVRLLKIDVEGYEPVALRGATRLLRRCEWALVEHSPRYMRQAGLDPAALTGLLADAGLEAHLVVDGGLVPIAPEHLSSRPEQRNVFWRRVGGAAVSR